MKTATATLRKIDLIMIQQALRFLANEYKTDAIKCINNNDVDGYNTLSNSRMNYEELANKIQELQTPLHF